MSNRLSLLNEEFWDDGGVPDLVFEPDTPEPTVQEFRIVPPTEADEIVMGGGRIQCGRMIWEYDQKLRWFSSSKQSFLPFVFNSISDWHRIVLVNEPFRVVKEPNIKVVRTREAVAILASGGTVRGPHIKDGDFWRVSAEGVLLCQKESRNWVSSKWDIDGWAAVDFNYHTLGLIYQVVQEPDT